ncbi:hypothetical protein FAY30_26475 (plasmid) [Bacillus sp. S3]|uniref:hypothetical protein n=1 Tax=Bacillus sp. S3 TaxID=486398 RepID=UPI0011892791|nr:hypothetical protein [Bacillus sp. S3]QCJ45488.1 hypothetical protein FAY30_26475 [Bacillus sp. S3]
MNKIFLAISKHETIMNLLKQKFPKSEITLLETKEQVIESLNSPFQLLITSNVFIDSQVLSNQSFSGQIIIFDPTGELLSKKTDRIHIYKNLDTVNSHIITKPLENEIIQQPLKATKEETKKENDSKETKSEEKQEPVHSKKKFPEQKEPNPVQKQNPVEKQVEANESKPVILENYPSKDVEVKPVPRYEKLLSLRKAAVPSTHKTIGVWSPVSTGISTFIVNFAIYMSEFDIEIAVVELPNEKQIINSMLTRFQSKPVKWSSFIENYFSDDLEAEEVNWLYKGVNWFPLGDSKFKWNEEVLSELLNTAKQYKLVFIDFPSGNMNEHSLNTLSHLDEFWILIDDNFHQAHEWKKEIHKIINEYKFPGKIIFNRAIANKSRINEIAELLELPLIAALPNHFEIYQSNNYEIKPPIELYRRSLEPNYRKIAQYLLGVDKVKKEKPKLMAQIKNLLLH